MDSRDAGNKSAVIFCIRVGTDMPGKIYAEPASVAVAAAGIVILKAIGKDVANLKIIQYNRSYEKFE